MDQLRDVGAERAVLAAVCAHGPDAYADVADLLTPRSLTDPTHQAVWACVSHLMADPGARVDFPSLVSAARTLGLTEALTRPEDLAVVRAVFNLPVRPESGRRMAAKLRKLEFAREAVGVVDAVRADLLTVTGDETPEAILARAEGPVMDLSARLTGAGTGGPLPVGSGLAEYLAHLAANQREVVGLSSGMPLYDRAIGGGLRPGTVNVIGARPKVGKSLLATNTAIRVSSGAGYDDFRVLPGRDLAATARGWAAAGRAVPVLQLDTEMTREDQWVRQLACVSGVPQHDIETGKFDRSPAARAAVGAAAAALGEWAYDFQSIAGQPFDQTEAVMRRWVTRRVGLNDDGTARPCLIVFDYLKLMDAEGMRAQNLAEFQLLGFMMTRLHNFAVRFKVPILTFVQLNRDGISTEDTSAASGSDRIVWLCSNFSIYKPKSDEEIADQVGLPVQWNRKLVPVVARHGAGLDPGDYINVMSYGEVARIREGPTRNQAARGDDGGTTGPCGVIIGDTTDQDAVPFSAP